MSDFRKKLYEMNSKRSAKEEIESVADNRSEEENTERATNTAPFEPTAEALAVHETKTDSEKTQTTRPSEISSQESSSKKLIAVSLLHEYNRFLRIRAGQLRCPIGYFFNLLVKEARNRDREDPDALYERCHSRYRGAKERTMIEIYDDNLSYLDSLAYDAGIKRTTAANYIVEMEMEREKKNGPRESIPKE